VLVTGAPGIGKTAACRRTVEVTRGRGLRVAGLISESQRLASGRVVQTVVNLRTGERRRLAVFVGVDEGDPIGAGVAGRFSWQFVGDAVRWGRHELTRCAASDVDLLVVDQLGPLELVAGSGWSNAVPALLGARFDLALVVVNPLVIDDLRRLLAARAVIEIPLDEDSTDLLADYLALRAGWKTAIGPLLLSLDGPDLLATDLDGTLLGPTGDPVAPRIEAALGGVVAAGAAFCVCTGRPSEFARSAARALGAGRGYAIAFGGAETMELAGDRVIDRISIPGPAAEAVRDVARALGLAVDVHDSPGGPLRLVLSGREREVEHAIVALQERAGDLVSLLRPSAGIVAVQGPTATKKNALAALARRLGVAPAAVAYFGDAADDAPALAWAGLGIAVGDGDGDAAAAADLVVPQSAVVETLARLALARRLRGARSES
jgi:hydroxymethylpyrimidine pyrophosphatase-like HAD family hydrolase/nucleoside-triphosphatase THEP1